MGSKFLENLMEKIDYWSEIRYALDCDIFIFTKLEIILSLYVILYNNILNILYWYYMEK